LNLEFRFTIDVDDIIMAALLDKVLRILDMFNNYHDHLKFTIEYETTA